MTYTVVFCVPMTTIPLASAFSENVGISKRTTYIQRYYADNKISNCSCSDHRTIDFASGMEYQYSVDIKPQNNIFYLFHISLFVFENMSPLPLLPPPSPPPINLSLLCFHVCVHALFYFTLYSNIFKGEKEGYHVPPPPPPSTFHFCVSMFVYKLYFISLYILTFLRGREGCRVPSLHPHPRVI